VSGAAKSTAGGLQPIERPTMSDVTTRTRTPTASGPPEAPPPSRTLIERLLSPIADVRREEAASALLMALLMFLVLGAYYELKTAREVFILSEGGAEIKSYSAAGQALLLLALVPAYGAFASRVNRERLVMWVTLFFVGNLAVFAAAYQAGLRIGIPYFLWIGIFNVMVIAQFWAFANDLYTPEQGKRLFPLIGVGSSLGAWVGSMRAGQLVGDFGPLRLLLSGGAILIVCAILARVVSRLTVRSAPRETAAVEKPLGKAGGFELIRKDRYLLLLAFLAVFVNVVNTTGEYLFGRYVVEQAAAVHGSGAEFAAARERFIGETYSRLFSTVNLLGFLLQMFVVSRVFKYLGVGRALFIHPIVAFAGYLLMWRSPSIQLMAWLKVADNSIDYSLGNTAKQALWLPTSREAKYKAKQAVDSFFVRAGDVLTAGIVFVAERLALATPAFAAANAALAAGWIVVVTLLNVHLRRQAAEAQTREL
jgi:AAA family ATP:ADP antiporter